MTRASDPDQMSTDRGVSRIIEKMQDGYFRVTPDGVVAMVNPAAVQILGYDSADELIGQVNVKDLYVEPSDREHILGALREHGEVSGYELDLKRRDDSVIRIEENVAGVFDANGQLIGQDGTLRDITERYRQAQDLARSEQQFRSLVKNSPGAIYRYVGGEKPTFAYMSDAILGITGYPAEFFLSARDPLTSISHPDEHEAAQTRRTDGISAAGTYEWEQRILTPAGEIRWTLQMLRSGVSCHPAHDTPQSTS